MLNEVWILLEGGDFVGAKVFIPKDTVDFYVYSGDMINLYHVDECQISTCEDKATASFLLDELATNFTIPANAISVEVLWDVENQGWVIF